MRQPKFIVQPQRSDGRGYIPCEPHRATTFAVVKIQQVQKRGKLFTVNKVIDRCTNANLAEGLAEYNRRSYAPTAPHLIRQLGRRLIKP